MGYYAHSSEVIRKTISERFPNAKSDRDVAKENLPAYLLWMVDEISTMNRESIEDALKAARWIGWIYAVCELQLNLWDNTTSRDLAREDKRQGNDLPIPNS